MMRLNLFCIFVVLLLLFLNHKLIYVDAGISAANDTDIKPPVDGSGLSISCTTHDDNENNLLGLDEIASNASTHSSDIYDVALSVNGVADDEMIQYRRNDLDCWQTCKLYCFGAFLIIAMWIIFAVLRTNGIV